MKYLVTGGAGFIGSHIVDALVAAGHQVVVLDNLSSGHRENLATVAGRIEFVEGDVRDAETCLKAAKGCDGIFHEAALVSVPDSINRPRDNHDINITGTLNVLEAARANGVRRVVFASSAAIYGDNPELPKREEMLPEPKSPYALAKLTGEGYLKVYAECFGLETVALRYFNVFGPRQDPSSMYSGVISIFSERIKKNLPITIYGDGSQTRDFVSVADVVQANLLAMNVQSVQDVEGVKRNPDFNESRNDASTTSTFNEAKGRFNVFNVADVVQANLLAMNVQSVQDVECVKRESNLNEPQCGGSTGLTSPEYPGRFNESREGRFNEGSARFNVFNVATGRQTALLDLLDTLEAITGNKVPRSFAPSRPGDIQHSLANISRARNILGYTPAVELKEGLAQLMG